MTYIHLTTGQLNISYRNAPHDTLLRPYSAHKTETIMEEEPQRWWDEPLYGRRPADLAKTPKVIGAGLPRTGITSFIRAVRHLLQAGVCHAGTACLEVPKCESCSRLPPLSLFISLLL
jgi:Sulfotransferase domain